MPVNVQIIFYSTFGHVYRLAEAIAEGARQVPHNNVQLLQVPETLPPDVLVKMGALDARKAFAHVPLAEPRRLADADAIFIGTPTRYGATAAQMQAFLDATGQLWATGALIGKVGSAFTSTGTQHGGQETTLVHLHTFFYHQGMLVSGLPYAASEILHMGEITGGTPYGASTMAGPKGDRQPTHNELAAARFQGKHVTQIAAKLAAK
jgi:NAD(P)H dehydrogenase (quinone)